MPQKEARRKGLDMDEKSLFEEERLTRAKSVSGGLTTVICDKV